MAPSSKWFGNMFGIFSSTDLYFAYTFLKIHWILKPLHTRRPKSWWQRAKHWSSAAGRKSVLTKSTFKWGSEFAPWKCTQDLGPLTTETGKFTWINSVSLSPHSADSEVQGGEWSRDNMALVLIWQGAEAWLRHLPGDGKSSFIYQFGHKKEVKLL